MQGAGRLVNGAPGWTGSGRKPSSRVDVAVREAAAGEREAVVDRRPYRLVAAVRRGPVQSGYCVEQQVVGVDDGHLRDVVLLDAALAQLAEELAQRLADRRGEDLADIGR